MKTQSNPKRVVIQPVIETGLPAIASKTQFFIDNKMVLELPPPAQLDHVARGTVYKRELTKAGFRNVKWTWTGGQDVSKGYCHHELSALPPIGTAQ
jgi:hypothetical protein